MRRQVFASLGVVALLALAGVPHGGAAAAGSDEAAHYAYRLVILGSLGGTNSFGAGVIDEGWIAGSSVLANNTQFRATLWTLNPKLTIDIGTLGGPNSSAGAFKDDRGLVAGSSDTATPDPLGENFCGDNSGDLCEAFLWQRGSSLSPLPPLAGGNNSASISANDLGQVGGEAENGTHDPACPAPQVLDYEPVIWQPNGQITQLPLVQGDTTGSVQGINDQGSVVGATGPCAPFNDLRLGWVHATLWQNGQVIVLPTLGGTSWNIAFDINEYGEMAGQGELTNGAIHALFWKTAKSVKDLGFLPGDNESSAVTINNEGQIVGESNSESSARGVLWKNGKIYDLNALIPPNSRYSLIYGAGISDSGIIVGQAYDAQTGNTPAFAAIPTGYPIELSHQTAVRAVTLPPSVMKQIMRRGFKRFGRTAAF
jgi:probable HAF family extracellular repeat protein